jgi:hypothetical protein
MSLLLIEVVGWVGAALQLIGYGLVSTERLASGSRTFQLLNLVGSVGILVNVLYHQALPAVALEVVWAAIAIVSLRKLLQSRPEA